MSFSLRWDGTALPDELLDQPTLSRQRPAIGCDKRGQSFLGRARFRRRPASPAFVGVVEGTGFPIAEQPSNFGNGQVVLQIALGKIRPQPVEHGHESEPLPREPTHERAWAHAEPAGDFGRTRLSMREERSNGIFYGHPECAADGTMRAGFFAALDQ